MAERNAERERAKEQREKERADAKAQSDEEVLDRRREILDVLNAITPADIQQAARTYLSGDSAVEIRVIPENSE